MITSGFILYDYKYSSYYDFILIIFNVLCALGGFRIGRLTYKLYETIRRKDMDS